MLTEHLPTERYGTQLAEKLALAGMTAPFLALLVQEGISLAGRSLSYACGISPVA